MRERWIALLICVVACSRTGELSKKPHSSEKEAFLLAPAAQAPSAPMASQQVAVASHTESKAACTAGDDPRTPPDNRIAAASARCGRGLKASTQPVEWATTDSTATMLTRIATGMPRCVRAVAVIREPGHRARLTIVDDGDRLLASAKGEGIVVVPDDGPLCVPKGVAVEIRLSAENALTTGLAAVLESP